jgi:hypothetical protein
MNDRRKMRNQHLIFHFDILYSINKRQHNTVYSKMEAEVGLDVPSQ